MFYVYILLSQKANKTYTGSTDDIVRRIKEHNAGRSVYTKRYKPWKLFRLEKFNTIQETRHREKYLKSCAGRKFIKKLYNNTIPR